jgi:hypothetical protein
MPHRALAPSLVAAAACLAASLGAPSASADDSPGAGAAPIVIGLITVGAIELPGGILGGESIYYMAGGARAPTWLWVCDFVFGGLNGAASAGYFVAAAAAQDPTTRDFILGIGISHAVVATADIVLGAVAASRPGRGRAGLELVPVALDGARGRPAPGVAIRVVAF